MFLPALRAACLRIARLTTARKRNRYASTKRIRVGGNCTCTATGDRCLLGPLRRFNSQPIYAEDGSLMYSFRSVVTDDYTGVEAGQEIAITRLEKAVDTVSVTNFAYASHD